MVRCWCSHLQLLRRQVPGGSRCWTVGPRLCRALRCNVKRHRRGYYCHLYISGVLTGANEAQTWAGLAVLFFLAGLDWWSAWSSGLTWGGRDWPEPWAPPDDPGWGLHAWERPQTREETDTRTENIYSSHWECVIDGGDHLKLWICSSLCMWEFNQTAVRRGVGLYVMIFNIYSLSVAHVWGLLWGLRGQFVQIKDKYVPGAQIFIEIANNTLYESLLLCQKSCSMKIFSTFPIINLIIDY